MNEHPILVSAPMVRAILDGRKTQTRRIIRWPKICRDPDDDVSWIQSVHQDGAGDWIAWSSTAPDLAVFTKNAYPGGNGIQCPYGKPGDHLWMREKWRPYCYSGSLGAGIMYYASYPHDRPASAPAHDSAWAKHDERARKILDDKNQWRSSIHMPRWASRLTLELTGVRVERVQDISNADALAEGVTLRGITRYEDEPRDKFKELWDSINDKKYPWTANPFVWVMEFKKL